MPNSHIEEHTSIRGVRSSFAKYADISAKDVPQPKEIYEIGMGNKTGNKKAAIEAFSEMAEALGDAISSAVTLIDGLVVIGGGLSGASELFIQKVVDEMNSQFTRPDGSKFNRLTVNTYNLENEKETEKFLKGKEKEIEVYGTKKKIKYDPEPRIGVGISKLGASNAISLGAYSFAINALKE